MPRAEGSAQIGLTLPQELKNQIDDFAKSKNISTNEFLRQAAQECMTSDLKMIVPEREKDIENFFNYIHGLTGIFTVAVQAEKNAEATERTKVQSQLNALEDLTKQNRQQQEDMKKLQDENERIRMELEKTKEQLGNQRVLQEDIKQLATENTNFKKENADLKEQLAAEKLSHANDVERINKESWERALQALSLKVK